MATFVRLGTKIINLDNIKLIKIEDDFSISFINNSPNIPTFKLRYRNKEEANTVLNNINEQLLYLGKCYKDLYPIEERHLPDIPDNKSERSILSRRSSTPVSPILSPIYDSMRNTTSVATAPRSECSEEEGPGIK